MSWHLTLLKSSSRTSELTILFLRPFYCWSRTGKKQYVLIQYQRQRRLRFYNPSARDIFRVSSLCRKSRSLYRVRAECWPSSKYIALRSVALLS